MRCPLSPPSIVCVLFCALMPFTGYGRSADRGVVILTEYFDLVVTGNIESAGDLWIEEARERSSRFGIEYIGIPVKGDCSSPIIRDVPLMRDYLRPPVKSVTELPGGNFVKLQYSAVVGGELIEHAYYLYNDGRYYWLTYPQDYYCQGWRTRETRYFRIHADPQVEKYLNPAVLEEADRFVERIADSLKLSGSERKTLREGKIEYFYCGSDSTVQLITGHRIKGTFDLASNDIISSFFPHYHELIHLLVNYKLRRLPLYTQPLMLQGLAVYFGGRWGQAPTALVDLGCYLYREDIVEFDSLLTMRDFADNSGADISYPLAGLFSAYLLDQLGLDEYLQLYLALSGNLYNIAGMTTGTVKEVVLDATDKDDWDSLISEFDAFIDRMIADRAAIQPGGVAKGKEILKNDQVVVTEDKNWMGFEFTFAPDQPAKGTLKFGYDERLAGTVSALHEEQYQGKAPFEGYRYGVRFDQHEAGLYDYATNHLVAKYIWGITPSDEYYDKRKNRVTVKFRKYLIGDDLPVAGNVKLLSQ